MPSSLYTSSASWSLSLSQLISSFLAVRLPASFASPFAGVWILTPGVRGALARLCCCLTGELNISERSCGAATGGEDIGDSVSFHEIR